MTDRNAGKLLDELEKIEVPAYSSRLHVHTKDVPTDLTLGKLDKILDTVAEAIDQNRISLSEDGSKARLNRNLQFREGLLDNPVMLSLTAAVIFNPEEKLKILAAKVVQEAEKLDRSIDPKTFKMTDGVYNRLEKIAGSFNENMNNAGVDRKFVSTSLNSIATAIPELMEQRYTTLSM